jgi:SRSO17 transposase
LAIAMLERAIAARVPSTWVLADAGYGRDPQLRAWCHQSAVPYVLGVPVDPPLDCVPGKPGQPAVTRADDLLHYANARDQWERRSCGSGAKGERLYNWTAFAVTVKDEQPAEDFTHWLVLRRSLHPNRHGKDGQLHREIAYFLVHAPTAMPLPAIIFRAGGRWQIEEDNEINKQLVGLAQYQVRKWTPFHRHVTACMLATAFLAVQRATATEPELHADKEQAPDPGKDQVIEESEGTGCSPARSCGPQPTPSGTASPPPASTPATPWRPC